MKNDTPQARHNLVAAVMICVLAGSIALAWLTTQKQKAFVYSGADVLAKLASEKIDKYWSPEKSTRWMVGLVADDKHVGWEVSSIESDMPAKFSSLQIGGPKGMSHKVRWTLSSDLSQGHYSATVYGKDGRELSQTQTTLTKDRVNIARRVGQAQLAATARRPMNYVPEGALPLVMRIVADTGSEIVVKMVFDEISIKGGSINFISVRLSPMQSGVVRFQRVGGGVLGSIDYHLDSENRVSRYEYPGTALFYRRCEPELISELFGQDSKAPTLEAKP